MLNLPTRASVRRAGGFVQTPLTSEAARINRDFVVHQQVAQSP
jgi:hypothetical protein